MNTRVDVLGTKYDVENFVSVIKSWYLETQKTEFGLEVDLLTATLDINQLVLSPDSDVLVLIDNDVIIGFLGIASSCSKLSAQKVAEERYYYVIPENRGISSLRLLRAAYQWAKDRGCTHFIIYASNLASVLHDRTCQLYEKLGMRKYETSYIKEL